MFQGEVGSLTGVCPLSILLRIDRTQADASVAKVVIDEISQSHIVNRSSSRLMAYDCS